MSKYYCTTVERESFPASRWITSQREGAVGTLAPCARIRPTPPGVRKVEEPPLTWPASSSLMLPKYSTPL